MINKPFPFLNHSQARLTLQAGLVWFCILIFVAGWFTPGYSHMSQAISELAAPGAPLALLVRFLGFIPLGLFFVIYGLVSLGATRRSPGSTALPILFILTGFSIILAGIFPTDVHGRRNSFSGMAHAIAGLCLLTLACITPLVSAVLSRNRSMGFRIFSFISGVALCVLFLLLPNGISPALIQLQKSILAQWFDEWYRIQGVDQRVLFLVYFSWLAGFISSE